MRRAMMRRGCGNVQRFLRMAKPPEEMRTHAISPKLHEMALDKRFASVSEELSVVVDPVRARFSAWYELFPHARRQRRLASTERLPTAKSVWKTLRVWASMWSTCRRFIRIGLQFRKPRNNATRGAAWGRLRQPVGHRFHGGRTQSDSQRAGNDSGFPAFCKESRGAWSFRWRWTLRSRSVLTIRMCANTSFYWFRQAAGWNDSIRGEPSEEISGHFPTGL